MKNLDILEDNTLFLKRHLGTSSSDIQEMLATLGEDKLDDFIKKIIPDHIYTPSTIETAPLSEFSAHKKLKKIAEKNKIFKSYLGAGFYPCKIPSVLIRNMVENPGWYTPYTPYQPEIAQGRLESLFNFQTMITDLTGLPVAGASLLDEATAAMEAVVLSKNMTRGKSNTFFASEALHPQTLAVLETRCEALGIKLIICEDKNILKEDKLMGAIFQYPNTYGHAEDFQNYIEHTHKSGGLVTLACDLLALTTLTDPGSLGADIAIGSSQRFACSLSYGGPHAGFLATKDAFKRKVPGRIVGLSKDSTGKPAYRLALQTREQHIRRESATSNICTAQALLANISAMYAVYHGPKGLKAIGEELRERTNFLALNLKNNAYKLKTESFFDTICLELSFEEFKKIKIAAERKHINLRYDKAPHVIISLDETTTDSDLEDLLSIFIPENKILDKKNCKENKLPENLQRKTSYLTHKVFKFIP